MITEAKKAKGKKNDGGKPKVEKNGIEKEIDPATGQPVEVTKPAKAMTGNPANPVIIYPSMSGVTSPIDPRNPMRNSQVQLIQSDTEKPGMLLSEYIDYARGKLVKGMEFGVIPIQGERETENQHPNHTGEVGMDDAGSDNDTPAGGPAKMGDVNQRIRRKAGKVNSYIDGMPGVWGGDDADYPAEDTLYEEMLSEGFKYPDVPKHKVPEGALQIRARTVDSPNKVSAKLMRQDGSVKIHDGKDTLNYKRGDYVLTAKEGNKWSVRGDIFRDTYHRHWNGQWSKKPDVKMKGYIADSDHDVPTIEGPVKAHKGDVVLQGTKGEWWPQPGNKAATKYKITPVF